MRNFLARSIVLLAAAWGAATAAEPPPPAAGALSVAAASDLQSVLPEVARRFREERGIEVSITYGASGQLAEQIKQGAPFDVFLSANLKFVTDLTRTGDVRPDSIRAYAQGSLVLVVNRQAGAGVKSLADLARPEVKKVALANPATAPYGAAARQALEQAGLWGPLEAKRVQAETVRQALQFVQTGNAEAGLVGRSIANVPEVRIIEIDAALHDPIVQGLGLLGRSSRGEDARAFADFVMSDRGQAILTAHGFRRVEEGVTARTPKIKSP